MKNLLIACVFLGLVLSSNSQLRVQTTTDKVNWPGYQDMAVDLMRQYLRINTSNPPGNEIEAAEFFKSLFNKYGIQNEIFEYKPGRANIIARLKGNGSKRPIILLSHMDVVTADPSAWRTDPFSAQIIDDAIYGRGALDMKSEGLLHLMTMIILSKEALKLSRYISHGSRPIADSAPNRLVAAMSRILNYQTPIKLLPAVEKFFQDIAPLQDEPQRSQFANIRKSLKDSAFVKKLTSDREYNFLLRNTISLTMLNGSKQTNVIPTSASCNIDVRLLPGEKPDDFLKDLAKIIGDDTITIENVNNFKPPNSSPSDTDLFRVISRMTKARHPEALITTKMLSGYTESQLYRQLGITCYGWAPIYTTVDENGGVHGNNERITVKNVREGTREFYEVVREIAR